LPVGKFVLHFIIYPKGRDDNEKMVKKAC